MAPTADTESERRFVACGRCRGRSFCCPPGAAGDCLHGLAKRFTALRRREILYRAGEALDSLYIVCHGSLKSCAAQADGRGQVSGFHLPGELLGVDVLHTRQHTADAVALEDSVVCEIRCRPLLDAPQHPPEVWRMLFELLREQAAHSRAQLVPFIGKQSASVRLAAWLSNLAERCESRGLGQDAALCMSQGDISSYLGLAAGTVSRLLGGLQEQGLIAQDARRIQIRNREGLRRLAAQA